jgi:hypothetical protein
MASRVVRMAFLFLALILSAGELLAQTGETGVIQGRVVADDGMPVIGARVAVAQADGAYPKETITGSNGTYRIGFLPPGQYELTVESVGYRTTQVTGIRVRASLATPLQLTLETAAIELETISVEATQPLIDLETTEYKGVLDEEEIDQLPTTRTATDLIEFTAGARPNQVWGGSTEQANSYLIDGVSVNQPGFGGDFLLPSVDWIKEVTVIGLGAGAEYGNFQGGQVNIVTKSGGNTFFGSLRGNYLGAGLNGSNLNGLEGGDEVDSRWELFGDVGGPIVKNKLYYYLSANYSRSDTRAVDILDTTCDPSDPFDCDFGFVADPAGGTAFEERAQFKALGKLTWQATGKDQFNLSLSKDDVYTDNRGLNSFDEFVTTTDQKSPGTWGSLSWQRAINPDNLFELKVTGYTGEDNREPKLGLGQPATRLLTGDRNLFTNADFERRRTPSSIAVAATWSSYFDTGSLLHHLKFGGNFDYGSWNEELDRTGNLTLRPEEGDLAFDAQDPATWGFISSDWAGRIRLDANTINSAFFVQDYITVSPRLTISPGLRLGIWSGKLNPEGGSSFTAVDDVRLAPRFGVTYDLLGDADLVVKGHYGWYYQNLFALMFDRAEDSDGNPGSILEPDEYWDWIGEGLPDVNRAYTVAERNAAEGVDWEFFGSGTGFQTAPVTDYNQPYVEQFIVGLEKKLSETTKLELVYVNRRNRDVLALVDTNLDTNYTRYEDVAVIDFRSGDPVLDQNGENLVLEELWVSNDDIIFVGDAPGLTPEEIDALSYDRNLELRTEDDAERKMDQVQLIASGRLGEWSVRGSVVYTDLRGNFFTVQGYDSPDGTGNGPYVDINEQANFFGKLGGFSDWDFKLQANGPIPGLERLRTGAFFLVRTGDRYTPSYTVDRRNHDFILDGGAGAVLDPDLIFGIDGQQIRLEERGSRKYDTIFRLDFHLEYALPIGRNDVLLEFDWFNVFNSSAEVARKTSVNNQVVDDVTTLYDAARARVPPSTVRLGMSLRF